MWKTIIFQISSKAFTYRNPVLQTLLLQGIHRLVHESLLLFQVCMKFVISNHPVYQLVSLLTPIRNQQLLTAFKFFRKQFFPRGFVRKWRKVVQGLQRLQKLEGRSIKNRNGKVIKMHMYIYIIFVKLDIYVYLKK